MLYCYKLIQPIMHLDEFEPYINPVILGRGLDYYRKGYVFDLAVDGGEISARVSGATGYYEIYIILLDDEIVDYECNCPYEGPVCKHVVAVLYNLQDLAHEENGSGKESSLEQLDKILNTLKKEELLALIKDLATQDRSVRQDLLARLTYKTANESIDTYRKQLSVLVTLAGGSNSYIDYDSAFTLSAEIDGFLENAWYHIQQHNLRSAFLMSAAAAEVLAETLETADDSSGCISDSIDEAMQILETITEQELPEPLRKEFLTYLFTTHSRQQFKDWHWGVELLELASSLTKTQAEEEELLSMMEEEEQYSYAKEAYQQLKWTIWNNSDPDKAEAYLYENLSNHSFRLYLLEEAYRKHDYDELERLAREGLEKEAEHTGLVWQWQEWLLKSALARNDKDAIVESARELYFCSFYDWDQQYLEIMSKQMDAKAWAAEVKALARKMEENPYLPLDKLAGLYRFTENVTAYMDLLERAEKEGLINLATLVGHLEYTLAAFPERSTDLYARDITSRLGYQKGRPVYQLVCHHLVQLSKWNRSLAIRVMNDLREDYANRPALLDELSKVEGEVRQG